MKKGLLIVGLLLFAGCTEPGTTGFVAGAAATKVLTDDAQTKLVEAVNKLNAETARINEMTDTAGGAILVKPETIEVLQSVKGKEKDPAFWLALASMLSAGFFGGKVHEKWGKK